MRTGLSSLNRWLIDLIREEAGNIDVFALVKARGASEPTFMEFALTKKSNERHLFEFL